MSGYGVPYAFNEVGSDLSLASATADPPRTAAAASAATTSAPAGSTASAPAAAAASTASTPPSNLFAEPGVSGVFLIEDVEGPQADVGDFLLTEDDFTTHRGIPRRR